MIAFCLKPLLPHAVDVILLMVACDIEQRDEKHIGIPDACQLLLHIIDCRETFYRGMWAR